MAPGGLTELSLFELLLYDYNNNNNTIYIAHQQPVKKIPNIRYQ
jgi:hypothetical protein